MLFGSKLTMAIDIGTSHIKLAEIEETRRGLVLTKFALQPVAQGVISGGEIVDPTNVAQAIEQLVSGAKSKRKHVATAMWGASVIVKKIAMPRMDEKLVAEQIRWEAEQYIPFDINEMSIDHFVLKTKGSSESMEVLLIAAKQDFVFRYIEAIEGAGLKCAIIDVVGFALANCFEANYGVLDEVIGIVNIGSGVTNLVVIEKGNVIFSRDVPVGGFNYTSEINKQMGVSLDEAEALKISASMGQEVPEDVMTIIGITNEQVLDEIKNGFEFFSATSNNSSIAKVFVTGGSQFIPGLVEQIGKSLNIPYEIIDPFLKLGYDPKTISIDHLAQIKAMSPVAIGLALRKLGDG